MDDLVKRFWNGQTSEAEEDALKLLCNDADFKSKYPETAAYFLETENYKSDLKATSLASHILKQTSQKKKHNTTIWWAAAAFALIISLVFWSKNQPEYSPEEIEMAYQQTQDAFNLIAQSMNNGLDYTENLNAFDEKTALILNPKNLDK